jgi:hypothetical protein
VITEPARETLWVLSREGDTITLIEPDGMCVETAFADLHLVHIVTNDSGPLGLDVWWLLEGEEDVLCAFPLGATGEQAVVDLLMILPGFDHMAMINAMSTPDNSDFVVWRRGAATV